MTSYGENFRILLVASEVAPFAAGGGSAEFPAALATSLRLLGNDARVVLPRYRGIRGLRSVTDFPVWVGGRKETAVLREGILKTYRDDVEKSVPAYFIDNYHYFDRDRIYGYYDEAERFAFFCRAVLEMCRVINFAPDVFHCNDWPTGPIPLLLQAVYDRETAFAVSSSLFTINHLNRQGNFSKDVLGLLGLGDEWFVPGSLEFWGQASYLKAGIQHADIISTVSRTYADEIQTPNAGYGLDAVLRWRSGDLFGVLNGIDEREYNPETDPRIYRNYSAHNPTEKAVNKRELQREVGLPASELPIIGVVARMVPENGFDLIAEGLDELLRLQAQWIFLGTGEPFYENLLRRARQRHPDRLAVSIGTSAILTRRIYAGADMVLVPSQSEPHGASAIIAHRYGTIPVVHITGGLADIVEPYDPSTGRGNGFGFQPYAVEEMLQALRTAVDTYRRPEHWARLVRAAFDSDVTWNHTAAEYMGLYTAARAKRQARQLAPVSGDRKEGGRAAQATFTQSEPGRE